MGAENYGNLSDRDLCVVNAVLYNDKVYELMKEACQSGESLSLYDVMCEAEHMDGGSFDECLSDVHTTREDWARIRDEVMSDADGTIASLRVIEFDADEHLGSRNVCFMDASGVPYVICRGTGTAEDGTEWCDNALGLSSSDTPQQVEARAFAEYIAHLTDKDVVVSGHSKGGNKAMYAAITSDCVARCVAFDGQGFGAEFTCAHAAQIEDGSAKVRNYYTEGDFVSPLLVSVAGEEICLKASNLNGDFARNHVVNCLLDDDLEFGERGMRCESSCAIADFTTWLDQSVSSRDRAQIGTFLSHALGAGLGGGDLLAALRDDPEGLGCLLAYVVSYPESDALVREVLVELVATSLGSQGDDAPDWRERLFSRGVVGTVPQAALLLSLVLYRMAGGLGVAATVLGLGKAQDILSSLGFGPSFMRAAMASCMRTRAAIGVHGGNGAGAGVLAGSGRVHDLTSEALSRMTTIIDEIRAEPFYDVSRWDLWYRIERAIGGLDISHYQGDIAMYYRKVFDVEGTTAEEVRRMFDRAWERDDEYARDVRSMLGNVRSLRRQLEELAATL